MIFMSPFYRAGGVSSLVARCRWRLSNDPELRALVEIDVNAARQSIRD
jgi:hypothetical protein